MLAIHLQRGLYEQGFKPNFQTNMVPLLATNIAAAVNKPAQEGGEEQQDEGEGRLRCTVMPGLAGSRAWLQVHWVRSHVLRHPARPPSRNLPSMYPHSPSDGSHMH